MNSDNHKLLNEAMDFYEQELSSSLQDFCEITQESHDFEYHFNDREKVCYSCGLIDSKPMLIISPENMHFRTKSNYSLFKEVYFPSRKTKQLLSSI